MFCVAFHSVVLSLMHGILIMILLPLAGELGQESQSDLSFLSPKEACLALLLIYSLLHHSSSDHVHPRS